MTFNIFFLNEAFGGFKEFYYRIGHQTQGPKHTKQVSTTELHPQSRTWYIFKNQSKQGKGYSPHGKELSHRPQHLPLLA